IRWNVLYTTHHQCLGEGGMYLDFYQLKRAPFQSTPDPTLLFLSPRHKAAWCALTYRIDARQGLVAITGDGGVGKTTLVHAYLARVDPQQLKTICIENARLTFVELLTRMCRAFDVPAEPDAPGAMVRQLERLLRRESHQDRNVALIIDEA